jgi:hypothetical protein
LIELVQKNLSALYSGIPMTFGSMYGSSLGGNTLKLLEDPFQIFFIVRAFLISWVVTIGHCLILSSLGVYRFETGLIS